MDAGLVGFLYAEVVQRLLVLREDPAWTTVLAHSLFTTLNSARCISGKTSSSSTRTLSPTLYDAPILSFESTTPLGSRLHQPGSLLTCTSPVGPASSSTKRPKAAV